MLRAGAFPSTTTHRPAQGTYEGYCQSVTVLSDNRIAAFATDVTSYAFAAPAGSAARVEVRLLFRSAYQALMDVRGCDVMDILMAFPSLDLAVR
jgi:hypothetical protein